MENLPQKNKPSTLSRLKDMLGHWLDSDYKRIKNPKSLQEKVDWERCIPFIILHLGLIFLIWVGWSPTAVIAAIILYVLRMFAITGFYHRYFSHRTFKTSRAMQFIIAVWGNTSMQRGALWWAANHRHHHKHSDTHEDLHSPGVQGFWWSHIGWITCKRNFPTDYSQIRDLAKYPELVFLNRFDQLVPYLYGIAMYAIGYILETVYPSLGVTAAQFFVWTFFVSTVFLLHGTLMINSMAHVWGKQRYDTQDDSKNSALLAIITLGEGWHNNHHRYPHSTRQGFRWWEIDITYYGLKIMSWLGLIRDLRRVPNELLVDSTEPTTTKAS